MLVGATVLSLLLAGELVVTAPLVVDVAVAMAVVVEAVGVDTTDGVGAVEVLVLGGNVVGVVVAGN